MTFYAYEGGPMRTAALSNIAVLLGGRDNATAPVLMVDWDTGAPGLHRYFGSSPDRPGLLEFFSACTDALARLGRARSDAEERELARKVLGVVRWQDYVTRVDDARQLYLMSAGCMDANFGERAAGLDWEALFVGCPWLYREFAAELCRYFSHVLVDARSGRAAEVSVCTALLPGKLVGLFSSDPRSLDGLTGVVERACDHRRGDESAHGRWTVYPLPCDVDPLDSQRRLAWRFGDAARGVSGYQAALEQLLRHCYSMREMSLASYFDEVQLQHTSPSPAPLVASGAGHTGDRLSLSRSYEALLGWAEHGFGPWQSASEIALLRSLKQARALERIGHIGTDLMLLGQLHAARGALREAQECFIESLQTLENHASAVHADALAGRASLAALLHQSGDLEGARRQYELLRDLCTEEFGEDSRDTVHAWLGLAATLASQEDFGAAFQCHRYVNEICNRYYGARHELTLAAQAAEADTLARNNELARARMMYENVLEGRQRLFGRAHEDTLATMRRLASLLYQLGELGHAAKLQREVLAERERRYGRDHPVTAGELALLNEIATGQCTLEASRALDGSLRTQPYSPAAGDRLSGRYRPPAGLEPEGLAPRAERGPPQPLRAQASPPVSWAGDLHEAAVRLSQLIAARDLLGARVLADRLREALRHPDVTRAFRRTAGDLVKTVYQMQEDKDALLAFQEEQVAALDDALCDAQGGAGPH
ncbi:tetratricopeptide repeat protein [Pseudoduganella sp. GCM10020061]|uniref:tetratricopeptide repeat protein n=1 Tax=Pseudoduganella sp. GCM10020061 TaxID=3317345 RepID=UPI00362DB785